MRYYSAPWSSLLIGISSFLTVLCAGITIEAAQHTSGAPFWLSWLPVLLALACALFTVRGYSVTSDAILVHRLFWATQLSRVGLVSVEFKPNAMRRSIRTFGNGGFYSFSGRYWSKALGSYRAFVTDPGRTVVLHYSPRGTVLLSPFAPEEFVHELSVSTRAA